MTSIIKNQIVKHLSKFARNLTPDQISLDVLKGKSKLNFIELHEEVLSDVLELPSWLRIRRAYCTGVAVNVPWTKLKSNPVQIFIDEIQVEVILTADAPPSKGKNPLSGLADSSSYGFANKVVEGMSIYVNTLEINFDSGAFGGSFMLSRLSVESRTPGWQHAADLRSTRISCPTTSRTLMYKQVSWQLLRIEASAKNEHNQRNNINAPLRLITSNGKIRIALKKNSNDGAVIHARIMMILEDILWVATLPQLRSAIAFYSHIMKLVKAAQKDGPTEPPVLPRPAQLVPESNSASSNAFRAFDFQQTSHHLHVKKIDLHLCDDATACDKYPPNWDIDSGAMQVTLSLLLIDFYPKTLATSDRSNWVRYSSPNNVTTWLEQNLKKHLGKLSEGLDDAARKRLHHIWPQLSSMNVVLRVYDIVVQCVSDMSSKRDSLSNLFVSDRSSGALPTDQFVLHAEFANFFHPMTDKVPVPPPATHVQLGPFNLTFDKRTLRWCLYVVHNLSNALQDADVQLQTAEPLPHTDCKLELLLPKVIIPFADPSLDPRLPHRLLVSMSTLALSNCPLHDAQPYHMLNTHTLDYLVDVAMPEGKPLLRGDAVSMNTREGVVGMGDGDQWWLSTSPAWVDTDHGERTRPLPLVCDVSLGGTFTVRPNQINAYVEPVGVVRVAVDHFQLLQLTRLSASLSDFADLLAADHKHFTRDAAAASTSAPVVAVVAALRQVRAHLILTRGPIASPYDACYAINELPMDGISDVESQRSVTPTAARDAGDAKNAMPEPRASTAAAEMEEFPEFPHTVSDIDIASALDDSMSVISSLSDEENRFIPELPAEENLYPTDVCIAEEAVLVDDVIQNDRHYKSLMAKNINQLMASLDDVVAVVNVHREGLSVNGRAQSVSLSQELDVLRSQVYAAFSQPVSTTENKHEGEPQVRFNVEAENEKPVSYVNLFLNKIEATLEDEILSHIGPFADDDQVLPNKVRLRIHVSDSDIAIRDVRKKKPMRLRIRDCVVEQDED